MKRIFIFALVAAMLLVAVPVKEVKAEETEKLTFEQALNALGYTLSDEAKTYIAEKSLENASFVICTSGWPVNIYFLLCNEFSSIQFKYNRVGLYDSSNSLVKPIYYQTFTEGYNYLITSFSISGLGYEISGISDGLNILYTNTEYTSSGFTDDLPINDFSDDLVFSHTCTFVQKETPATCTESGKSWEECECGAIQNETVLSALGHSFGTKVEEANCNTAGKTWEECSVCGTVQNETVLPALGHGELIYSVVVEPTTEKEGTYKNTCSVCDVVVETGSIPKLDPVITPEPTVRPTVTPRPTVSPGNNEVNVDNVDGILNVTSTVLRLFTEFPLNVFLLGWVILLGVNIYAILKRS